MSPRIELIEVNQLRVNPANPRFSDSADEIDAVAKLIELMPQKMFALASDIARMGMDPSALPLVLQQRDGYLVLEGNRRVAAIQILNNPQLLSQSPELMRRILSLIEGADIPASIFCTVVDTQEEADHWIVLRHTGEHGGAGTVRWGAVEQQRFTRRRGSQTDIAIEFGQAIARLFPQDSSLLQSVETVLANSSTTLGRLLQSVERRSRLGFERVRGIFRLRRHPDDILPMLVKLFNDLESRSVTVTDFRSSKFMNDYAESLARNFAGTGDVITPSIPVDEWVSLQMPRPVDSLAPAAVSSGQEEPALRGIEESTTARPMQIAQSPQQRRELHVFQGIRLGYMHPRLQSILGELQRLSIDASPNLCAIMIRVFLDLAAADFAAQMGWQRHGNRDFADRIRAVIDKVDPSNDTVSLVRARELVAANGALSPKSLNGFVHSLEHQPLAQEVRALSAAYGPLLTSMNEYIRDNRHR